MGLYNIEKQRNDMPTIKATVYMFLCLQLFLPRLLEVHIEAHSKN